MIQICRQLVKHFQVILRLPAHLPPVHLTLLTTNRSMMHNDSRLYQLHVKHACNALYQPTIQRSLLLPSISTFCQHPLMTTKCTTLKMIMFAGSSTPSRAQMTEERVRAQRERSLTMSGYVPPSKEEAKNQKKERGWNGGFAFPNTPNLVDGKKPRGR